MKQRMNPLELGRAYVRLQVLGACFPSSMEKIDGSTMRATLETPNPAEGERQR